MFRKINGYVENWEKKGIINEKQKKLILNDLKKENNGNFFKIISFIGAIFIGFGILLIISSNWEYFTKPVKLIITLLMPILSIYLGYYLSYIKKDYKKIGDSFIFLGTLLIGASLGLLGQIYNLESPTYILLFFWMILVIPFTYFFKFRLIALLNIALFYLTTILFSTDKLDLLREEKLFLLAFTLLSLIIMSTNYLIRNKIKDSSTSKILDVFWIFSAQILSSTLFISIINKDLYFFGESFISGLTQNILFIIIIILIIWISNRVNKIIPIILSFIWVGIYILAKYVSWFWRYMETGLFFTLLGVFLISLVFIYIKFIKYFKVMKKIKKNGRKN